MKLRNKLVFLFLFISLEVVAGNITMRMFGAIGDGKTDDTQAFKKALEYCQNTNSVIDGESKTYFVKGRTEVNLIHFSLRNINFVTSSKYSDQFSMKVISNRVDMENVMFDGGRGTYKTELENWKDFAVENNTVSIYPDTQDLFYFVGLTKEAVMNFRNIRMENIHAASCITAVTYGQVFISQLKFKNISNKTFHIYHSADEGKFQSGRTTVEYVEAEDIGILPEKLKINMSEIANRAIKAMPQASFNFIVSFGEYYLKGAKVNNYGSSGITSDRNLTFVGDSLVVSNDSGRTFSNNPSAAIWFEATANICLNRAEISVDKRDPRDLRFDSSAFHIYGVNTKAIVGELYIKGNGLNKGLRGSFEGINSIRFQNVKIDGVFKQAAALLSAMPGSKIESIIEINKIEVNKGVVEFYGIKDVNIQNFTGITGMEHLNFKLPENTNISGRYTVKRTNIRGVYKSSAVNNLKIYDSKNRVIQTKNF